MPGIHPHAKKEIDRYIASTPAFAQPICRKLRTLIKKAEPEIVEDWKWGPNFNKDGMVCGFGAFKEFVSISFFKGALLKDPKKVLVDCSGSNAGSRRMHFRTVDDIDEKLMLDFIKQAVVLNKNGVKAPARRAELAMPPDLKAALTKNAKAKKYFDELTPGYRREYIESVLLAKRPETHAERIKKAVTLCAQGKTLNDKYKR
jgi:uncharacterized protein YdeI (YjbR/CyaY-like superfamily)